MAQIIEYGGQVIDVAKATKEQKEKLKADKPKVFDKHFGNKGDEKPTE